MVADGGLPGNFGGILAAVREVNALTGWGRVVLQVKNAATRLGLTDRHVTHRNVKLKRQEPIGDSLVFLMIGRDAADGQMRLTPVLRCFDIRWSRSDSAGLFAGMREVAGQLADAAEAKSFFALDAGPLGKFITVHPLGGCPMADDPARGRHRPPRPGARLRRAVRARRFDRPDRAGREPVQDDRRPGRARRRASAGASGGRDGRLRGPPHVEEPSRQPADRSAADLRPRGRSTR